MNVIRIRKLGYSILLTLGLTGMTYNTLATPLYLIPTDDTTEKKWDSDFSQVEIKSSLDGKIQKAYFYSSHSEEPRPLIVSLHTWSGDYSQFDDMSRLAKQHQLNYIHPDFRGANDSFQACGSEYAMRDIDDAITYAINHSNTDTSRIFVIGGSGGGYATLYTFMKSRHSIKKFSAWVPITDLIAWYKQSVIRENKYANDILNCTGSMNGKLNHEEAKKRSPMYMKTPVNKLNSSELLIYTGIYDGIQGAVPITHAINFYNKVLTDLSVKDSSKYVSDQEKLKLLEFREPLDDFGYIRDREVCLKKQYKNLKLVVFEGGHDMLGYYVIDELLDQ